MNIIDITRRFLTYHCVDFDDAAFFAFWELGYTVVKIRDEYSSDADVLGDTYNPAANPDIPVEQLKREERAEKRRIREKGMWGFGLALKGEPIYSSFIWGFVGDDFIGSGYDNELLQMMRARPVEVER